MKINKETEQIKEIVFLTKNQQLELELKKQKERTETAFAEMKYYEGKSNAYENVMDVLEAIFTKGEQ